MRFRAARPTNALAPLERFYVDGLGLTLFARFEDHAGFSGFIAGAEAWEVEFLVEAGVTAPRAPTAEHLLVLYVADDELEARARRLDALGFPRVTPNNGWWVDHGITFEDPDGYHFVLARMSASPTRPNR